MQDTLGLASRKAPPTLAADAASVLDSDWLRPIGSAHHATQQGYIRQCFKQSSPRTRAVHLVWKRDSLVRISHSAPFQKRTEHNTSPRYLPIHCHDCQRRPRSVYQRPRLPNHACEVESNRSPVTIPFFPLPVSPVTNCHGFPNGA